MKHLPNIITALRIVGSIGLLFCNVAGWQFWTLYVFCGISDMIDGWFARKLKAESKTGSVLDSIVNQYTDMFCNPMVMWGKYRKHWFKTTLPISFQFHHTQMDGAHAGKFLANLQNEIHKLA